MPLEQYHSIPSKEENQGGKGTKGDEEKILGRKDFAVKELMCHEKIGEGVGVRGEGLCGPYCSRDRMFRQGGKWKKGFPIKTHPTHPRQGTWPHSMMSSRPRQVERPCSADQLSFLILRLKNKTGAEKRHLWA